MAERITAPWLADVRTACLTSLSSPAFGAWVRSVGRHHVDAVDVLQALADDLGETLAYRFDGARHRIASWQDCRSRGWGACADVGAHLAAAAIMLRVAGVAGPRRALFALEAPASMPDYAHLRVVVRRARPPGRPAPDVVLDPMGIHAAPMRARADYLVAVDDVMRDGRSVVLSPGAPSLSMVLA
jgi:hypothetical protein